MLISMAGFFSELEKLGGVKELAALTLGSAVLGGGMGALSAKKGERRRGATKGALMGAGVGAGLYGSAALAQHVAPRLTRSLYKKKQEVWDAADHVIRAMYDAGAPSASAIADVRHRRDAAAAALADKIDRRESLIGDALLAGGAAAGGGGMALLSRVFNKKERK